MDFFTSDLHLGLKNIIIFCNRPFKNVHDMNRSLVKNWNSVVTNNDTVYVLGDVFVCNPSTAEKYIKKLMDRKTNVYLNAQKAVELGIADIVF